MVEPGLKSCPPQDLGVRKRTSGHWDAGSLEVFMLEDYYVKPSANDDRVRATWVATQIDMLFSDVASRDVVAVGIAGRNPKMPSASKIPSAW